MKNILVISVIFLFSQCIDRDIDYTIPYQETPVAIGFIDSVNGARVFVGKNADIFKKDSSLIKGVSVSLWGDDTFIENLSLLEKNVFISSKNFTLKPNVLYSFKAYTPLSKDSIFSEKAAIPATIPIKKAYFQNINEQKTRINLFIEIEDPVGFNGYSFYIQRFKKDTLFDEDIVGNPLFTPSKGYIYNDREFEGKSYTFKLENINVEEYIDKRFLEIDRIKITLFNMNRPTYNFLQSIRNYEPGIGDPFFEPITIQNQVKNGLGLLAAYSSFQVELKIR